MSFFQRRRSQQDPDAFLPEMISPDAPFCAVGDLHGRIDLLERIEKVILRTSPGLPTVFVGDYIDRGEHSADVLRMLASGAETGEQPVICLMGNHEEMCLNFIDAPCGPATAWLRHGGLQTLASFGIGGVSPTSAEAALTEARDALVDAMGPDLLAWLRARPLSWQSGNVAVAHAGADPTRAISAQSSGSLLWGHPGFANHARKDGVWVIHGHVVHEHAGHRDGRIWVDTGAYATGRLSGVHVLRGELRFFSS